MTYILGANILEKNERESIEYLEYWKGRLNGEIKDSSF